MDCVHGILPLCFSRNGVSFVRSDKELASFVVELSVCSDSLVSVVELIRFMFDGIVIVML